jgi:hypothetical protein
MGTMNEQESIKLSKGEVLKNAKNRPTATRAKRRAKTMALLKQVKRLVDLLGPHKEHAIEVLARQLEATRKVYDKGIVIDEVPDQIVQQKAAIAILEWLEGKPRELQIHVGGKFEDLTELQNRVIQSEAFKQITSQKAVEGKVIPPALPVHGLLADHAVRTPELHDER